MEKPNLSYINAISDGDKVFQKNLIDIIKKELPLEIAEYKKNLKAENYKLTAENVHKLKHKISILGLTKSYDIAVNYENDLKENNVALSMSFKVILENMSNFINTL